MCNHHICNHLKPGEKGARVLGAQECPEHLLVERVDDSFEDPQIDRHELIEKILLAKEPLTAGEQLCIATGLLAHFSQLGADELADMSLEEIAAGAECF